MNNHKDDLLPTLATALDAYVKAKVDEALERAADLLDNSWNYWNSVAYDKRQAGLSDNQACHAANETQRLAAAIRAMKE